MPYSQYPHQELYLRLLLALWRPRHRFFIDVGAFDGISFSNVRWAYDRGWSGLCVEPASVNYEKLERRYRGTTVQTVRAAVADYVGEAELQVAEIPGSEAWGSDTSTLLDGQMKKWPSYRWSTERVPVRTLDSLLECGQAPAVDLISIDVEGAEAAVLRGFDLARYRPRVMIVEYNEPSRRAELLRMVRPRGYAVAVDNGTDLFLVRARRSLVGVVRAALAGPEFSRRVLARVRTAVAAGRRSSDAG
jgi:FkbM family methyltransferase